jgi:hypothetical protein
VDVADLVRVHETGIAHHVAAIGEIDGEHGAAAILYGGRAVVMQMLVFVGANVAAGENVFQVLGEFRVDRHQVFEMAMLRAVLDHPDFAVAFDDLGLDLAHLFVHQNVDGQVAVENLLANFGDALGTKRIGRTRPAERRLRLFPGLEQGFSDHLGIGASLGAMRLRRSNTAHAPVAATVTAFSTYLIGLCILLSLSSTRELELPHGPANGSLAKDFSTLKPGSFDAWSWSH